jgi:hypothetical protein
LSQLSHFFKLLLLFSFNHVFFNFNFKGLLTGLFILLPVCPELLVQLL